jgi:small-conductance mechanosensitive channel
VDRRLPIALLGAIALQSATAVWWAATVSQRVDVLEKRSEALSSQGERLVRVEEKVTTLQEKANQLGETFRVGFDDIKQLVLAQLKAAPRGVAGDRSGHDH